MILEKISRETGVDTRSIEAIINSADSLYKTYSIRKKNGGLRHINHPTPTLKFLQRWIVRNFITRLPVHQNVISYRKGVGVHKNAAVHASSNYLLKMDFKDFFPSITTADVKRLLLENKDSYPFSTLSANDIDLVAKIACKAGRLTIGAPSSPSISNAALFRFDTIIARECERMNVLYSRYADDICFSTNTPNVLSNVKNAVQRILLTILSPRITINDDKTVFTSKKRKRLVTGLVLTSDRRVSIGRTKKRYIKGLCHRFILGNLSNDEASYLYGYLSYIKSVEPIFIQSLKSKYGEDAMRKIMDIVPCRRKD
jgi:hypothetical protein